MTPVRVAEAHHVVQLSYALVCGGAINVTHKADQATNMVLSVSAGEPGVGVMSQRHQE
jgi:hypothetical protein